MSCYIWFWISWNRFKISYKSPIEITETMQNLSIKKLDIFTTTNDKNNHEIYSLFYITVTSLLSVISGYVICHRVLQKIAHLKQSNFFSHFLSDIKFNKSDVATKCVSYTQRTINHISKLLLTIITYYFIPLFLNQWYGLQKMCYILKNHSRWFIRNKRDISLTALCVHCWA